MADDDQVWTKPGEPRPVVPLLIQRIAGHSPELVLQMQHYLRENGEDLTTRQSYNGTDPSARLSFTMIEALLAFEQLRVELLEQTDPRQGLIPAHLTQAMSEVMVAEPALLHLTKTAFQLHLLIWNAHEGAVRPEKTEEDEEVEEIDRGRWGPL